MQWQRLDHGLLRRLDVEMLVQSNHDTKAPLFGTLNSWMGLFVCIGREILDHMMR